MQGVHCDKCGLFVRPGDYGNEVLMDVPLHFAASDNGKPIAIVAVGRNAVLAIGQDLPLYSVCPGSTKAGVVEEIPDEPHQLRGPRDERRERVARR